MADEEKGPVPYERFAEVNRQLADARRLLDEQKAAHTDALREYELRAKHAEKQAAKYQADHEGALKQVTELQGAVEAERLSGAFAGLGLTDPELRDFVRGRYLAVEADKDGKRPDVATWFGEYSKDKPYLQPSQPTTTARPPSLNGGAKDPAPKKLGAGDITAMTPEQWKAQKDALLTRRGA